MFIPLMNFLVVNIDLRFSLYLMNWSLQKDIYYGFVYKYMKGVCTNRNIYNLFINKRILL